jgi:hypothetical protein
MALINVSSLDFVDIRQSIKDQLKSNSNFTDYNFEGSTLSFLIDVLAYNTYISSYNANMISNEIFIDSATIRENVVALARNIGYIPRPKKSAKAIISFTIDTTNFPKRPQIITLKKGPVVTSSATFGNQSYVFSITEDITVPVINNIAAFDNVNIYEGTFIQENILVDANNKNQRFILSNPGIDYTTLSVLVKDDAFTGSSLKYSRSDALNFIDGSSKVYFIQEVEDERYELIFGDGIFGKKLVSNNVIEVNYITSNGDEGNGIGQFTFSGTLVDNDNVSISRDISAIFTNQPSSGGLQIESIKSIKNYAPRTYASQNRAVTSNDYESIVKLIYPEAESITSFGGEELDPPRFGRVFIAIKPTNGLYISSNTKQNIKRELKKYSVAGIVPEIMDVRLLYITFESRVFYNSNLTDSPNDIKTKITNNITELAKSPEINQYGSRFKYSKFLSLIDNSDKSIVSNDTNIQIRRILQPIINKLTEYEICYGNKFLIADKSGFNIRSSGFKVSGISETVYLTDIPNSDGITGSISLFTFENSKVNIVRSNIGKIDYDKGEINLSAINIVSTTIQSSTDLFPIPIIEISTNSFFNDVYGVNELFLQLDVSKSEIIMINDDVSSKLSDFPKKYTI